MNEDRRVAPRQDVVRDARGRSPATPFEAIIRNISMTGCMVDPQGAPIAHGATVLLDLPEGISVSGQVIWTRQGNIGLQFHRPLRAEDVSRIAAEEDFTSQAQWTAPAP